MLMLISPAKTLDFDSAPITDRYTEPKFLDYSAQLVEAAREMSPDDIRELMGVSAKLAELNHRRFMNWGAPFTLDNARQAMMAFRGDVYSGLDVDSMNKTQIDFAQRHLRILSGLYGVLAPLDLIQPYRLEMGLKFSLGDSQNLYRFWGGVITEEINRLLEQQHSRVLLNLASNEYFKSVQKRALEADVITPVFKDLKAGTYRVISFYAKRARGQMARFIIDHELNEIGEVKEFDRSGYSYNGDLSTDKELVFTRDIVPGK